MNLEELLARLREITGDDAPTQRQALISAAVTAEDIDLAQLADQVREKSSAVTIDDDEEITDEQVAFLSTLAEVSEGINTEVQQIEAERAAEARKATATALAEKISGTRTVTPEPAPATVPAQTGDPGDPGDSSTAVVTAGGKRATPLGGLRRASRHATEPIQPTRVERAAERYTMVASSDGPGVFSGQEIPSMAVLASVAASKVQSLQRLGNATGRSGIATFNRHVDPTLLIEEQMRDFHKLEEAANERLLPGGSLIAALENKHTSLVAAGNANGLGQTASLAAAAHGYAWCSPMEIINQLCPLEATLDGMLDLPTITTTKGGVMWPATADYADVFADTPFCFSHEDMNKADFVKPCVEIPCREGWDQCVLEACSFCIIDNILLSRVDDSQIQRGIAQGLNIYRRGLNAKRIKRVVDITKGESGGFINVSKDDFDLHGPGLLEALLSYLSLQVQHLRAKKRLSTTTTFEGIAPMWLRDVLRVDLSKKLGIQNRWSVTDADVDRLFASRGIRLQYVWEWQDAGVDPTHPIGGNLNPKQWPNTVQILLYQSGAFQAIQGPSVQLDAVYDRENLQKNKRVRMFLEDMWCLISRCGLKYLFEFPLCPNGQSGSHEKIECKETPPVVPPPVAVTTLTADNPAPTADTVTLKWEWAKGSGGAATGFEVQYRTGSGQWSTAETVPAGTSPYTKAVSGLQAETPYEFRVTAVGAGGSATPVTANATTAAASGLLASGDTAKRTSK
ncbi:major capsid protein [Streptomyces yaizuensis]|uniref:Major capsid protein n=1 Tax=Streptomyces yaizuensis TaxID=2989713 RepID=A0AA86J3Q6_9ACTN|nr:major capsid protein [Streptomyces sp. YSPA8]BDT39522.1 major capsid protein [Streptomyces sp. YSPA8]